MDLDVAAFNGKNVAPLASVLKVAANYNYNDRLRGHVVVSCLCHWTQDRPFTTMALYGQQGTNSITLGVRGDALAAKSVGQQVLMVIRTACGHGMTSPCTRAQPGHWMVLIDHRAGASVVSQWNGSRDAGPPSNHLLVHFAVHIHVGSPRSNIRPHYLGAARPHIPPAPVQPVATNKLEQHCTTS